MKYLVVGLGNIGPEYRDTRHNAGFMVVDALAKAQGCTFDSGRLAFTADFKHKARQVYLIKPTTYMNLSGKAVNYWMKELKVPPAHVLVIVDDIALPFGKLRLKPKGSSAGHNGLKNIEQVLGNSQYPRLRFGVGDDFPRGRQVDYVLSPFTDDEFAELPLHIERACDMVMAFTTIGIDRAMNQFNQ